MYTFKLRMTKAKKYLTWGKGCKTNVLVVGMSKKLIFPFSLLCFSFIGAVETENNSALSDVITIRGVLSA